MVTVLLIGGLLALGWRLLRRPTEVVTTTIAYEDKAKPVATPKHHRKH